MLGWTPLQCAVRAKRTQVVALLLGAPGCWANADAASDGLTPLQYTAARRGNSGCAHFE